MECNSLINPKAFAVGDKVYCRRMKMHGVVISITDTEYEADEDCEASPVRVRFSLTYDGNIQRCYSESGQLWTADKPSLQQIN